MTSLGSHLETTLPKELLQLISQKGLSLHDILTLCTTSQTIRKRLCEDPYFWTTLARMRLTANEEVLADLSEDNIYQLKVSLIKLDKPDTPLDYFAGNGYEIAVKDLLPRRESFDVDRALFRAGKEDQRDIIEIIMKAYPLDQRNPWNIVLSGVAAGGHLDLFEEVFPLTNEEGRLQAYRMAAKYNQVHILAYLVKTIYDDEAIDKALDQALFSDAKEAAAYLLSFVDQEVINQILIDVTINNRHNQIALLAPVADADAVSESINEAVERDDVQAVSLLLPYASQQNKNYAFIDAARRGNIDLFQVLLPEIFDREVFAMAMKAALSYGRGETADEIASIIEA